MHPVLRDHNHSPLSSPQLKIADHTTADSRVVNIATHAIWFPRVRNLMNRLGLYGGYCKLHVEGKLVLVKISEISKALRISTNSIERYSREDRLEELIDFHQFSTTKTYNTIEFNSLSSTHLDSQEIASLQLLSSYLSNQTVNDKGMKEIDQFITKSLGNIEFQHRLALIKSREFLPSGVTREAIDLILNQFTTLEIRALTILKKYNENIKKTGYNISEEDAELENLEEILELEKTVLTDFFNHIHRNQGFNQRIHRWMKIKGVNRHSISSFDNFEGILRFLAEYSYKSKDFDKLATLVPKLEKIASAIEENRTDKLKQADKIHLFDLKLALSLSKMHHAFSQFAPYNIDFPQLKKLKEQLSSLSSSTQVLEEEFYEQLNSETGDIYIGDALKEEQFKHPPHRRKSIDDRILELFFSPRFGHTSIGIKNGHSKQLMEVIATDSSFPNGFSYHEVDLRSFFAASIYRLDFSKLMTKHGKKLLNEKYRGSSEEEIANLLRERYNGIVKKFYEENSKLSVSNSLLHRLSSVLRFSKRWTPNDFDQLRFQGEQLLCSEFVARLVAVSLHKMEKEIREETQDLLSIDGRKKQGTETILTNPFKHANFGAILPDKFHEIMQKFVKPVEIPSFMNDIFVESTES